MTVPVPGSLVYSYAGDGVSTSFSYPVRFMDKAEITVLVRDGSTDTAQVLNTDYTIAGSLWPAGGSVVFGTAPASGKTVILYRDTVAKQLVDLENTQRNDAGAVETQLDRFAMVQQDQGRRIGSMWQARPGETSGTIEAVSEGHLLIADEDGNLVDGGVAGTAANADANSFATSLQGSKADSAVQPGTAASVPTNGTLGQVLVRDPDAPAGRKWSSIAAGVGDMISSAYDPQGKGTDAFDMDNMSESVSGSGALILRNAERAKIASATRTAATRTALGGLDPTVDGTARLLEVGFEGDFITVDPAGYASLVAADTVGGEIKATSNPNLSYLRQRQYGDYFKTSECGGDLGVAVGLASLRHGKATVEINELGTKVLPAGLSIPANISLVGSGSDRVTLDISGLAAAALVSNGIVTNGGLYIPGSGLIAVAATRSAMNKGEKKVTFTSSHPFKAGDIMVMANPSDYSAGVWTGSAWTADVAAYRARQSFTVASVEGLVVHTMEPAEFTFDTTGQNTANCYRQLPARGRYGGFTIDNTGNATNQVNPLTFAWLDGDTQVEDICVLGATYTGIRWEQCHNLRPRRLQSSTLVRSTFTTAPPTSSGNDYASLLTSCYNVIVKESKFAGNWAACDISTGYVTGGGTSINSGFEDCDISNTIDLPAAGIHGGGTINCGYHKSRIIGPAGYGGRSSHITDCSIYLGAGHPSNAFEAILTQGIISGTYDFSGTKIYSDKNAGGSGRACIDLNTGGGRDTYQTEEILYLGRKMEIVAPNETRPIVALNWNANYTASFDLDFAKAVVPSAGVFLVVSLKSGNPANVATKAKLSVEGLPSACAYASFSQGYTAAEMKFPQQVVDYTETPTAAATLITSVKTLNHAYPTGYPVAARWDLQDIAAGTKAQAKTYSVSTTTARGIIFTGDGTNLTAAATRVRMTVG